MEGQQIIGFQIEFFFFFKEIIDGCCSYCAVVFDTVIPEAWSREFLPDDHSHAVYYALTHSHNVSWKQGNLTWKPKKMMKQLLIPLR